MAYQCTSTFPPEATPCLMNSIPAGKCLWMFSKGMSNTFITLYLNSYLCSLCLIFTPGKNGWMPAAT